MTPGQRQSHQPHATAQHFQDRLVVWMLDAAGVGGLLVERLGC